MTTNLWRALMALAFCLFVAAPAAARPTDGRRIPSASFDDAKRPDVKAPAEDAAAHAPVPETNDLEKRFDQATALLYAQMDDGGYRMMCTATAFEKHGEYTRFVSAAHCLSEDNRTHERVEVAKTNWFISFDRKGDKTMYQGTIVAVGYQSRGDDFAVIEVKLDRNVPLMPLAKHDPGLGEEVINFASPLGLGKQLFRGHVSMEKLDRPITADSINWRDGVVLQINSAPGSSGSAIVSVRQKGIVAFIVGSVNGFGMPSIIAIQVSRFRRFWTEVQSQKYRWYRPDLDNDAAAAAVSTREQVERLWQRIHANGPTYGTKRSVTPQPL